MCSRGPTRIRCEYVEHRSSTGNNHGGSDGVNDGAVKQPQARSRTVRPSPKCRRRVHGELIPAANLDPLAPYENRRVQTKSPKTKLSYRLNSCIHSYRGECVAYLVQSFVIRDTGELQQLRLQLRFLDRQRIGQRRETQGRGEQTSGE